MKKALAFTVILLVLSTSVFASRKFSVSVDPFSFQHFACNSEEPVDMLNSTDGIGIGICYDCDCKENCTIGAEIKADTYFFEDKENFTDITLLVRAGYLFKTDAKLSLYGILKAGIDFQLYEGERSAVLEFGPEIKAKLEVNDKLSLFASIESLLGFPGNEENTYTEIRVTPAIGVEYSF